MSSVNADPDVLAVEQLITQRSGVSFVEIERLLTSRGVETKGPHALVIDKYNIALWAGMSERFVAVMDAVQARKNVSLKPTSCLVYLADGGMLRMPLAKRTRRYKELHWAPVVFNRKAVGI
jgi:hypothetical protein